MALAKSFVMELARSPEYCSLQEALRKGDKTEAEQYQGLISQKVDAFALETGTRITGYDMNSIAARGSLTPVEQMRVYLMEAREHSKIGQLGEFREALNKQARKHIPAWYNMGNPTI